MVCYLLQLAKELGQTLQQHPLEELSGLLEKVMVNLDHKPSLSSLWFTGPAMFHFPSPPQQLPASLGEEPGRSKSDHESVCAVPCEFYISLTLICWKWSCQGHVEIKCCSMVVNIEEEKKLSTCWGLHGISDVAYRLGQSTGS